MLITEVYYNDYLFILYILIVNTCGNKIYKIMFPILSNAHFLYNRTPNEHFAYSPFFYYSPMSLVRIKKST
jgi:hypothetical protein